MDGSRQQSVPVKLEVATIEGFSGHSDRMQLMNYVASVDPRPQRVILSHGEESKALDLSSALHKRFNLESRVPYNLEAVRLI